MADLHETVIELSGSPEACGKALSRAGDAIEKELQRRYPSEDGHAVTMRDESAVARQAGQVFRETRSVKRARFAVDVALIAQDYRSVKLITRQGSSLNPSAVYAFMGAGAVGGAALLVSQRPDLPLGGLAFWSLMGLCCGGGAAIGVDKLLQPKLPPETLSGLHGELRAIVEKALAG